MCQVRISIAHQLIVVKSTSGVDIFWGGLVRILRMVADEENFYPDDDRDLFDDDEPDTDDLEKDPEDEDLDLSEPGKNPERPLPHSHGELDEDRHSHSFSDEEDF